MRDIAQVFPTPRERAGEFNSVPILTPKRIPLGDYGRITNRNGDSGDSRLPACSSRQPAANRFRAHIRLAKEDIRRSGRMQQAGSLRSPDSRLRSRQWKMAMSTSAGQRSGVALPIALMIGGAKIYFIVFGILTIAGGILGYVKAGSTASIIAGSISGVLLLLAAWLMPEHQAAGLIMALIVSLLLAGQFIPKFFRTFKVMPAGLMSVLSAIGIIVAIAAWLRK